MNERLPRFRAAATALIALAPGLLTALSGRAVARPVAEDPLVFAGREAAVVERAAGVARGEAIDFHGSDLRLSPDGARWALRRAEDGGRWVIGDFHGGRRELAGSDLGFLDERRVVVLAAASGAPPEVLVQELDPVPRVVLRRALPRIDAARLDVDAASGRWRVSGIDFKTRELVRISGSASGDETAETRWASPPARKGVPLSSWAVGDGENAVDLERTYAPRAAIYPSADAIVPWHSEIWSLGRGAARRLASTSLTVRCLPALAPGATCLTVNAEATYLWSVDPRSGELSPLASVRGRAREEAALPGGRVALWLEGSRLAVVDAASRRAELLTLPGGRAWGVALAPAGERIGVLVQGEAGSAVLLVER